MDRSDAVRRSWRAIDALAMRANAVVTGDPRDLSSVFVRRPDGPFVEARYRELAHPPISLWERNAAVRKLNANGRREVDEVMIFGSVNEQRAIEDASRRQSVQARFARERRPLAPKDKPTEVRLRDIDTGTPMPSHNESGSAWDEP